MRSEIRSDRPTRDAALERMAVFRRRVLPSLWRRLLQWKGFDAARQEDLVHDLEHEVLLDCLANAEQVLAMPERDCFRRWLKLLQTRFYVLFQRPDHSEERDAELDALSGASSSWTTAPTLADLSLDDDERRLLACVLPHTRHLKNGRLSIQATARAAGLRHQQVRTLWHRIATRLDRGEVWVTARLRRLAESLCALAASRLPSAPALDPAGTMRSVDPESALRQVRAIVRLLERMPLPREHRALLARLRRLRLHSLPGRPPRVLLELAGACAPDDPRVALWSIEAARAAHDLGRAMLHLRDARRRRGDRVACAVARARLLVDRGQLAAAERLLGRALRRGPDLRLRQELAVMHGFERAALRYAPSGRRERRHDAVTPRSRPATHH